MNDSVKPKRSNLAVRFMTAGVAAPVILWMLFVAPAWVWPSFVFLLATPIAASELFGMTLTPLRVDGLSLLFGYIFLLAALLGQQISSLLHVEVLLTLLVAGFVAVNLAREKDGEDLRHAMERAAGPVFVVFFALAGVAIDVPAAVALSGVVIPMVLVRLLILKFGVQWASKGLELEPVQRDALWQGLVAQAGVAIGLVSIVAEAYPEVAGSMRALLLAIIADGTAGFHDRLGEHRIADHQAGPGGLLERVLGQRPIRMRRHEHQQVEDLGLQGDDVSGPAQLAALPVQLAIAENQGAGIGRDAIRYGSRAGHLRLAVAVLGVAWPG